MLTSNFYFMKSSGYYYLLPSHMYRLNVYKPDKYLMCDLKFKLVIFYLSEFDLKVSLVIYWLSEHTITISNDREEYKNS